MIGRITLKSKREIIYRKLSEIYPETHCFLNYTKDYELLFAVILSAQATDKSVNEATDILFQKFTSLDDYRPENKDLLIECIRRVGLVNSKANYLLEASQKLRDEYHYQVPRDRDELLKFKGVGYKTSAVVLGELFNEKYIPVDTHVFRVTHRLGLVKSDLDLVETEDALEKAYGEYATIDFHRRLILLGRDICHSQKPECHSCPFANLCPYFIKNKKN